MKGVFIRGNMEYDNLNFENDKLNRKQFVKNIMNIVDNWDSDILENKSLVIAIDSAWGSGKSYLLNMWRNWLLSNDNEEKNYAVAYYNAWESDDSKNAFIPLTYSLLDLKGKQTSDILKDKSKVFIKSFGMALLKDGINKFIGEETCKILNDINIEGNISEAIDEAMSEKGSDFYNKYEAYIKQKENFRANLRGLVPDEGKLIVFIDELDRCRPKFAIETLEIVKHYFNLENVVFIFAVDLEQLGYSISTMYGQGMDAPGYLRRFFDLNLKIPVPNLKEYVYKMLDEDFHRLNLPLINFKEVIIEIIIKSNLSLRDINKILKNFYSFLLFHYQKYFNNGSDENVKNRVEIYFFFIVLKYKYPNEYSLIMSSEFLKFNHSSNIMEKLDRKFFLISDYISDLLKLLSDNSGKKELNQLTQITNGRNYNNVIININDNCSIVDNIQMAIEMFV